MKSLKTRILSGVMAGVLAASMAVPAFAASNTTNITGTYAEIPIEVSVPQTGTAQINPYGLPIALDDDNSIVGEQIVTKPLYIVNNGLVALSVSASVTAEAKGDLKFVAAAPAADDLYKSAFVYLQMKSSALVDADKESEVNITAGKDVCGFKAASANPEIAAWEQSYNASKDLVLNGTRAAEKADMIVLAPVDSNDRLVAGGAAMVRLAGQVTASPREAWATTDGFTASVAFTFKPDATTAAITGTANIAASGTTKLTATLTGANITNVVWASDTASVATVVGGGTNNVEGTVTNAGTGTAKITATITADNGMTYTAEFTVTCA